MTEDYTRRQLEDPMNGVEHMSLGSFSVVCTNTSVTRQ